MMTKLYQLTVFLILIFSVFARIVFIDRIPTATFIDEYNLAVPAAQIALGNSSLPWSGFGWYATPGLFFYYVALVFKIVGISNVAIKTAWLLPASISLPLVYLLGKNLFKSRFVGLMSLQLFGFNVIAVHMARWGHGSVITATFQLAILLLFWFAEESKTNRSYFYAGLSAFISGMSLYFYVGARSFVLLLPLYFVWYWIFSHHAIKKKILTLMLFSVVILFVSLPMILQISKDQFNFIWRLQEASIIQKEAPLLVNVSRLATNIVIYLRVAFDGVDRNIRHNPLGTTIFPYYFGVFIPIGLIAMFLTKNNRKQGMFLLIGLLLTMAGGILSKEAPSYFRVFGSLPMMSICIAVTFFNVVQSRKFNHKLFNFLQVKMVIIILLSVGQMIRLVGYYQLMFRPTIAISEAFSFPEQVIAETIIQSKKQNNLVYIAADYVYSSTIFLTLPKIALSEYVLFDVDSLLRIDRPVGLVLDSSAKGLQSFLENFFIITYQSDIQTGQVNLPVEYEIIPNGDVPAQLGLMVECDDGSNQILQRKSLGIYHSFSTFPENMVNCRWSGKLNITKAGDYQFKGKADDSLSLQLSSSSGTLIVNQPATTDWLISVNLDRGTYELIADYQNKGGARAARLEWLQPDNNEFTIVDPLAFIQAENHE